MTNRELKQWHAVTNGSRHCWAEDSITRLNGQGALYYVGGATGCFMRITPEGKLTIGSYKGAFPHIGEACFQAEAEKNCGNYYKAFEKACELGGTKFLTDLFSGSQISQEPIRIQPEEKAEQEKMMEKIEVDKALLNVKEVCAYLGIGETKARELLTKTNNHFTVRIGNRVFANKIQLDKWIAQNSGNKVEKRRTIQRRVKKEEPDMGMQIMM